MLADADRPKLSGDPTAFLTLAPCVDAMRVVETKGAGGALDSLNPVQR